MSDDLPDRLSSDPRSPFYDAALLERGVGIRFNGAEKTNVEEYCVSEGWVRVPAGNAKDRYGKGRPRLCEAVNSNRRGRPLEPPTDRCGNRARPRPSA